MLPRDVKLPKSNSFFLFGARGTGKSTLLRSHFRDADHHYIDLLDPELLDVVAHCSITPNHNCCWFSGAHSSRGRRRVSAIPRLIECCGVAVL